MSLRLSLCMIVKNEAAMLPGCLASVRGVVDEIVVIDTGSTDNTCDIARGAGARVSSFDWCDDFAAARNESIAHATGNFILVLDADERLAFTAAAELRRAMGRGIDCGVLRLHNASSLHAPPADVIAGRARIGQPRPVLRLFRRGHEGPFRGRIHEGIEQWVRSEGLLVSAVDADIIHLGATEEMRRERGKQGRNLRLLELRAAEEPDEAVVWGYLAAERIDNGDDAGAWDAAQRGWQALVRAHAAPPPHPSGERLAAIRAKLQIQRGAAAAAIDTLHQICAWEGPRPLYAYLAGAAFETQALAANADRRSPLLEAAAAEYRACLAAAPDAVSHTDVPGMTGWQGRLRLGTVLVGLGRPHEAAIELLAANENAPVEALIEVRLAFAEACIDAGDFDTALIALEGTLGDRPDGWVLAAALSRAAGAADDAVSLLAEAGRRSGQTLVSPHRRARWQHLKEALACTP
jgi:tetratricopeptide (TPR) repeat protein